MKRSTPKEAPSRSVATDVAQAFQPAGSGDFPVASRSKHGTGMSGEPADRNVCDTPPWTRKQLPTWIALALILLNPVRSQSADAPKLTTELLRGFQLRNIGPALQPGRVADIAVDPRNRSVWYVATASSGLWKTKNRGESWEPIFDEGDSYSLGCVTLDPNHPDTVWLGAGENQALRSVSFGTGLYKSTDAGESWNRVGLKNSEHIGKILVDPRNSDVVFVAAQGPLWAPGGDRGLFKTTDGGKTWKAVLTISE